MPTAALFVTCVADQFFPDTAFAAARLLEAAGVQVTVAKAQTCCGQPALSAGQPDAAARLAAHFLDVFSSADAIVAPSGSCAAMVRHWYTRVVPDRGADAEAIAGRTFELTQYIVSTLGITDVGADLDGTIVTLHDACHGLRDLGVGHAPRQLLESAGADIVDMAEPETCCGFGGVFATEFPEVSTRLADAKLDHAEATRARWLVSTDLACLAHLDGRRRRAGRAPEPIHIADLLVSGLER